MIGERELRIITALKNENLTAEDLSKIIGRSSKTIRRSISNMEKELLNYGAQIMKKPRVGYSLVITNQELFSMFIKETEKNKRLPITVEERVDYIMERLFFDDEKNTIETFSNELLVSEKTVERDLQMVKKLLTKYNLQIMSINHQGLKILGKEFDIRWCIYDCIENFKQNNYFKDDISKLNIMKNILHETFIVNYYEISDYALDELVFIIYLVCNRIERGYILKEDERIERIVRTQPYEIATYVSYMISKQFNITFTEQEMKYIALQLAARQRFEYNAHHRITEYERFFQRSEKVVEKMFRFMNNIFGIDFSIDNDLFQSLAQHVAPLIVRIDSDMVNKNSLTSKIIQNYPITFFKVKVMMNVLFNKNIHDDEVAFLALYFENSIEKIRNENIKHIAIVYDFNIGVAKLVRFQLQSLMNNYNIRIDLVEKSNIKKKTNPKYHLNIVVENIDLKLKNAIILNDCKVDYELFQKINEVFHSKNKNNQVIKNQYVDSCQPIVKKIMDEFHILIKTKINVTTIILLKEDVEAMLYISQSENLFVYSSYKIDDLLESDMVSLLKL